MTQQIKGWAVEGSGNASTTLQKMRRLARDASRNLEVIQAARGIVRYHSVRDYDGQARTLRDWLSAHLRFVRDPKGTELLQTPKFLLNTIEKKSYAMGDCDDAATLSAALATAIGFQCVIEAVGFYSSKAPFQHVYTLVIVGRNADGTPRIVDMDTTRPARNLPPTVSRRISVKV